MKYLCWIFLVVQNFLCVESNELIVSPRDSSGWGGGGWGSSVSSHYSFFDIALTALAFMSFGIFLLNLLMNALFLTTTQGLTSTGPIITMTGLDTATGEGGNGGGGEPLLYIRRKRDAFDINIGRSEAANALSATVLQSIDAMFEEHECTSKAFCDANRQAKTVGYGFQYVMPLYSFSSSYLGEKMGLHKNLSGHMDGILHGSSQDSNCRKRYPNCSLD